MLTPVLYVLAAIGGIAVLRLVYVWLIPKPTSLLPERLSAPIDRRSGAFLDSAGANLDAPVIEGNSIDLLVNGDRIFPAMLEAIERAERSINFLTYVYWTGGIAQTMADTLTKAAERGVEVRLLLDFFGAQKMDRRIVDRLEKAGAKVAWFHPVRWYHLDRINNRTHRKVLVTDGRVGFTGGVGIAEEWEGDARDESEWRDDHFRLRGPVVRYLQGAFASNWRDSTGEVLAGESLFPALDEAGSTRIMPLVTSPRGSISPIAFLYWMALQVARERVDIATPYFLPNRPVSEAIRDASAKGVRIRMLLPDDHNDAGLLRAASYVHYPILLEGGVELYEFEVSMMHTKTVVVDDRWAIVGSANFDNRSFELNDEITLAVEDPSLVGQLDDSFCRDLERSRRITDHDLRNRSLRARATSRLSLMLREQL